MTTLNLSTGSFDHDNKFTISLKGLRGMTTRTASLEQGYQSDPSVYWAMLGAVCIQDVYSIEDRAQTARLNAMTPIKHNDIVTINNEYYKVRVLGECSDCAIFEKL